MMDVTGSQEMKHGIDKSDTIIQAWGAVFNLNQWICDGFVGTALWQDQQQGASNFNLLICRVLIILIYVYKAQVTVLSI